MDREIIELKESESVYTIYEYRPSFVESDEELKEERFKDRESFDECSLVKRWKSAKSFSHFSVCIDIRGDGDERRHLMAEFENGKYYVVGFLEGRPEWLPVHNG